MESSDSSSKQHKNCRTCVDFKSWSAERKANVNQQQNEQSAEQTKIQTQETNSNAPSPTTHLECPVDKDILGRSTWNLLHTVAAYYPDEPTDEDKNRISQFFKTIAISYPCEVCAEDFQKQIARFPPKTDSQHDLTQWLCRAHNRINLRTGKPQFDCSKVNERWRDGWKDGSCDV